MDRNKIVGTLLVLTAVFFVIGALYPINNMYQSFTFYKLGFISGLSAVFTRLLIKENK